jgi:hypothetical protein
MKPRRRSSSKKVTAGPAAGVDAFSAGEHVY